MQVAVTGADGFTGRYVLEELERRGHAFSEFSGDLTKPDEVEAFFRTESFDAVIHLAAIAFVHSDDHKAFYEVNQLGTLNLLEAIVANANRVPVLLASSANVYGQQGGQLSEAVTPQPVNHYAVSKLSMEHCARLYDDKLDIIITRPFNYTGVGQEEQYLIPKIVKHFRDRADRIELGNLDVARDFGGVDAVASAYCQMIEKEKLSGTFNIGTGKAVHLRTILDMCRELTGHDLEVAVNPAFVRVNDIPSLCGDIAKLRQALPDWKPTAIRDVLARMLGVD